MTNTINNNIPFVPENTIDPAAGLNESLNVIDPLLQCAVLGIENDPPATPNDGDRYIVGDTPTGDWIGEEGRLTRWLDGMWSFFDVRIAVNLDDSKLYINVASGWIAVGP
jgi:hypothetical protein